MRTFIAQRPRTFMAGAALGLLLPLVALACGDKLVVLGGGVPFERVKQSQHPGKLVLYAEPNSRLRVANDQLRLSTTLSRLGHTVVVVQSREELDRALKEGNADLVLMDWTDAVQMQSELASAPSTPSVLSVLYEPSATEVASAEEQLQCVAETSKRKDLNVMRTVEQMMETREKGLPADCPRVSDRRQI